MIRCRESLLAPITNWDWTRVGDEEQASGVTWGEYHLVGTYDGTSFTVLDVGPPEPSGGLRQPDAAGFWIKIITPGVDTESHGPNDIVVIAAFTGDLEKHRLELAAVWGGPLCAVEHSRTEAELARVQDEISARDGKDFGVQVLYSSTDVVHDQVVVGIVVLHPEVQTVIDDDYGIGNVRLMPALEPLT